MRTGAFSLCGVLLAALVTASLNRPAAETDDHFTLAAAIPNDVFLYVAERPNPEREFLNDYWREVMEGFMDSGVTDDLIGMFGSLIGAEQLAEIDRLRERAEALLAGVDWHNLAGKEFVFVERFTQPEFLEQGPPIMMPEMVWLFRGSHEGAASNYEGLLAILDGIVDEVNSALGGRQYLVVNRTARHGAAVAEMNPLASFGEAPSMKLTLALRDDVVLIGLRGDLLNDVLALMEGSSSETSLRDDPRFRDAFAQLPPPEDFESYFDMQALMTPLREFLRNVIAVSNAPRDSYMQTSMNAESNELNGRAVMAYRHGDISEALELVRKAYEVDPDNSIVLYNLACFNALEGNRDEALDWLQAAVKGGFHAPRKIATDSDLITLRGDARYEKALALATRLASEIHVEDVIINSARSGEAYSLVMQAWQAQKDEDYEQGLQLSEQALAVDAKDSRVLYSLARAHALLGHEKKALDFLQNSVGAGYYCPVWIGKDKDLQSIRHSDRYHDALSHATEAAAALSMRKADSESAVVLSMINRIADSAGILDYTASVQHTEGFSIHSDTIAALVPDARTRAIYPVLTKREQLREFDRFLPEEAVSFSISTGINLVELYKFIEDSFREAGPVGEEVLSKWSWIQGEMGVDVHRDVLAWLDGASVSAKLADGSSVVLIKVKDEQAAREKVASAVEFLSTQLSQVAMKNRSLAMLGMLGVRTSPVEREDLQGFQNLHFTMSPQPVVWGVSDGYLIMGSSADTVALCLATSRGEHPNIRHNARVMSEAIVPDGEFWSASLTDKRGLGEEMAAGMGMVSMIGGMAGASLPDPQARMLISRVSSILAKLTPVVRKIDFYKSTSSQTRFDGQAYYVEAVTHYMSPDERAANDPN